MEFLDQSSTGVYRVTTESATYVIDLDLMVMRRTPHPDDADERTLRRDGDAIVLLAILRCTLGRPMILCVDLALEGVPFTVRMSNPVAAIEPLVSRVSGAQA